MNARRVMYDRTIGSDLTSLIANRRLSPIALQAEFRYRRHSPPTLRLILDYTEENAGSIMRDRDIFVHLTQFTMCTLDSRIFSSSCLE